MSRPPAPSIVLLVVDVSRVSAFYRELASMTPLHQDDAHVVLAIDGVNRVAFGPATASTLRET